jgi:hypothetical protein
MAGRAVQSESEVCAVLLETYGANDGVNQLLLEHLDARAWRASPEGKNKREGRTIAGIFAHLHNNRVSWIKNSAPAVSCAARSRALHDQADTRSSPAKRSTMPGDAEGSSIER